MLVNHSHFNYRGDIINTIVPFMNHSNQEVGFSRCMKGVSNGCKSNLGHGDGGCDSQSLLKLHYMGRRVQAG